MVNTRPAVTFVNDSRVALTVGNPLIRGSISWILLILTSTLHYSRYLIRDPIKVILSIM